jgi:N-6 DNA Methylase
VSETLFQQLLPILLRQSISSNKVAPIAVALLVAVQEDQTSNDAATLFQGLARRLTPQFAGDASELVADWLNDPGLSSMEMEAIAQTLAFLKSKGSAPIDWSSELAQALSGPYSFGLTLPVSRAISRAINLPLTGTCACLFQSSASIAWVLSADREVTIFPADRDMSIILTLLARAACRPLKVNRRNPVDGTHMPAPFAYESHDHRPPFEAFDYIISAPPFGPRVQEGPNRGMSYEVLQAQKLLPLAHRSFTMLVPDGILFRETRSEVEFREQLLHDNEVKVTSLPTGIWLGSTGIQTSIVSIKPRKSGTVTFVDGRTMDSTSRSGRGQEMLVLEHLDMLDEAPTALVPVEELEANAFSLAVSRYVLSDDAAKVEAALENRQSIRLGDIARIIRPKAPLASRGQQEPLTGFSRPKGRRGAPEPVFDEFIGASEITPSDIVDGQVELVGREVFFDPREAARVHAVAKIRISICPLIRGGSCHKA